MIRPVSRMSCCCCFVALAGCTDRGTGEGEGEVSSSAMESDTTSVSASDEDSNADTTAESGILCGDGALDPGEACDDGNDVDGDGCNHDCVISGSELWVVVSGYETCGGIAVDSADSIFLIGRPDDALDDGVHVARFDEVLGERIWQAMYAPPEGIGTGGPIYGLRTRAGFIFAGVTMLDNGIHVPWSQTRDAEGELLWESVGMDDAERVGRGILLDDADAMWWSLLIFDGGTPDHFELWRVLEGGDIDWITNLGPEEYEAGGFSPGNNAVVMSQAMLESYNLGGGLEWSTANGDPTTRCDDVAIAPNGDIFVVVQISDESVPSPREVIRHFGPNGGIIGEFNHGASGTSETVQWDGRIEADSSGDIIVVTREQINDNDETDRLHLAKYAADGTHRWSQVFLPPDVDAGSVTTCGIALASDNAVFVAVVNDFNGEKVQTVTVHKFAP